MPCTRDSFRSLWSLGLDSQDTLRCFRSDSFPYEGTCCFFRGNCTCPGRYNACRHMRVAIGIHLGCRCFLQMWLCNGKSEIARCLRSWLSHSWLRECMLKALIQACLGIVEPALMFCKHLVRCSMVCAWSVHCPPPCVFSSQNSGTRGPRKALKKCSENLG